MFALSILASEWGKWMVMTDEKLRKILISLAANMLSTPKYLRYKKLLAQASSIWMLKILAKEIIENIEG